jgi:hypothetical protein
VQLAVDAVRVEAAGVRDLVRQVGDVQDLTRGPAEREPVGIGRHDVGLPAHRDAMIVRSSGFSALRSISVLTQRFPNTSYPFQAVSC